MARNRSKTQFSQSKKAPEANQQPSTPPAGNEPTSSYTVRRDDTIVLILGQTGAGKSTFINHAIGAEVASVGHGLNSHTTHIEPHLMTSVPGHRIVLVDTPGFNDTWASDRDIMKRIVAWLQTSCKPEMKFAGIVYLHEISQARANPDPENNVMNPTKLSKPEAPKHVILATVKWGEVPQSLGELRENQLRGFWRQMSDGGSTITRFADSTESARAILSMFPAKPITVGYIQHEFLRILGMLPPEVPEKKVRGGGFISKLFGKVKQYMEG